MSQEEDIRKIYEFVTAETAKFVTHHNGGVMPTAEEIMAKSESYEFPEIATREHSSSYIVWDNKHVMEFKTKWEPKTEVTSIELTPEQWPSVLKLKLAKAIELKTADGKIIPIKS